MNIARTIILLSGTALVLTSTGTQAYYSAASVTLPKESAENVESTGSEISEKAELSAPSPSRTENIPLDLTGKNICTGISDLSALSRPEVRDALFKYLTSGREFARRGLSRYSRYKPEIDEIFNKNPDIPREIMHLPLLESGYSPTAVSRKKAVGVWQIIAPTAKGLGLKITPLIDERQDPVKSTEAAISHLRNLQRYFKSWDLSLAAYNCGSSRVIKGMRRTKTECFWTIASSHALRKETVNYIPQFAALSLIASHPDLFLLEGDQSEEISPEPYMLQYPVRLRDLATLLRIDVSMIRDLNPELTGPITPVGRSGYTIKLPAGSSEIIAQNEESIYTVRYNSITTHTVRRGDSLKRIAKRYGVNADEIAFLNQLSRPYFLKVGRAIYIPRT